MILNMGVEVKGAPPTALWHPGWQSDILSAMTALDITANTLHSVTRFRGFSLRENAGTPAVATVRFREASVSGQILFVLELAADESATLVLDRAVVAEDGIYVEVVAGTIEGVIFH